jgi:hypothetical protein
MIAGRCPECGATNKPQLLRPSRAPFGSIWDDLDGWLMYGLIGAPVLVLIILGAIFIAPEIGLGVILLLVGWALLNDWFEFF